jgi:hypothetical protein
VSSEIKYALRRFDAGENSSENFPKQMPTQIVEAFQTVPKIDDY